MGGVIIYTDDNTGEGRNARIKVRLSAGYYTIEALPKHNATNNFTLRVRTPKVKATSVTSIRHTTEYTSRFDFNPRVIVDQISRHDYKRERISGVRYNSFAEHQNNLTLRNSASIATQFGKLYQFTSTTHGYHNGSLIFTIQAYDYTRDAVMHAQSSTVWGGTKMFHDGKASTEYLYRADRRTYVEDHWGFKNCAYTLCPRAWAKYRRMNLWGGIN